MKTKASNFGLAAALLLLYFVAAGFAQSADPSNCLSVEEITKLRSAIREGQAASAVDEKLRQRLITLRDSSNIRFQDNFDTIVRADPTFPVDGKQIENDLCQVLKENGWPTVSSAGKDGAAANLDLLKNTSVSFRLALLPVLAEAVKKNELPKNEAYAAFIDRLRVQVGKDQLFGTQVVAAGDLFSLVPIEDEANVNARRNLYGMNTLTEYIKSLEMSYRTPVVRDPRIRSMLAEAAEKKSAGKELLNVGVDTDDVIRIDTNLVNLDVSVYPSNPKKPPGSFSQNDFRVLEDGKEQEISNFSKTDTPFDMVLLLDVSGSTEDKLDLIRKSAVKFINTARPIDRIALVTIATDLRVISPLTSDRMLLLDRANSIEGGRFSRLWDAVKYSMEKVLGPKVEGRKRAVVFMTDGQENSLMSFQDYASKISFFELMDLVRKDQTLIIPIDVDRATGDPRTLRLHRIARTTLTTLAEESGGLFYEAKKLEDLKGVYSQVLEQLSRVYSVGYVPSNEKRDGHWRTITVQIPSRPDMIVHTRNGYFAN